MATHHLLVVDDEPHIGRIVRMQFERAGYAVTTHTDARAGLEHLAAHPEVDCLLLDLNMPGMTGVDLLELVRRDERFSRLVVVVLTAAGQIGQVERAQELGAATVVTKPFSPKKLFRQVAQLLGDEPADDVGGEG